MHFYRKLTDEMILLKNVLKLTGERKWSRVANLAGRSKSSLSVLNPNRQQITDLKEKPRWHGRLWQGVSSKEENIIIFSVLFPTIWPNTPWSGMLCEGNLLRGQVSLCFCSIQMQFYLQTRSVFIAIRASYGHICKEYPPVFLVALMPETSLILHTNPVVLTSISFTSACYWLK